ncbi:hypothetical protein [Paenibacillus apii]|uniref:hypothetical protein n=1 Tax=Paenibacillus apii TaxID=1850370 RepID=UPI00143C6F80|nr:hypothetical protein [Paenibacillus apii]NJJ37841.1 hypothetical protein [Paenibacillus apii]
MADEAEDLIKLIMDSGKEYVFKMKFLSFMRLIEDENKFCLIDKGVYIVPKHISSMELIN